MGKMKYLWALMESGHDGVLQKKYEKAVENQQDMLFFDNGYIPLETAKQMLNYMDKRKKEQENAKLHLDSEPG